MSQRLLHTSKLQDILLEELANLQKFFTFFPKDPDNHKAWCDFLSRPKYPIDQDSLVRIVKAVKETFSNKNGDWLTP